MQYCAVDGKKGGIYTQRWDKLVRQIEDTCLCSEAVVAKGFGKKVEIFDSSPEYTTAVRELGNKYKQNGGKLGFFSCIINSKLKVGLKGSKIDGKEPQTAEDCELILQILKLEELREQCAAYWNELFAKHDIPQFNELDLDYQEQAAAKYIPLIKRYQSWFNNEYTTIVSLMGNVGLPCKTIFQYNPLDSEVIAMKKMLLALTNDIPVICEILECVISIATIREKLQNNIFVLQKGKRIHSDICKNLIEAINKYQLQDYKYIYENMVDMYAKSKLKCNREKYLDLIAGVAPRWAEAIRNREGIHGESLPPDDIFDAWKWKQYYGIIENLTSESFSELQKNSLRLSKEYRKVTAKFAEKLSWYHLLRRTENDKDMQQALHGWKQTVKRIGKGTGINAPKYRAEARKLMVKCQNAVPGWIMPISKALESLNPGVNKFDIIIIDEASQADISALAILYMGKKLIVVGDDKQVSPMAVGVQIEKINILREMYIANKIPNAHLYDAKMSIYDIAATTFKPLMLREHFRCVPEIIGFSNSLSYDFKIKPLRDCTNNILLPSVINYRVLDGYKQGKTNPNEAKTIVALLQACLEQTEYQGKTFGIISLLGDDQVKKIQEEIYAHIDSKICNEHRILCGNASNFQGDERDVVFLSLVDCVDEKRPLAMKDYGVDDAYRKRYNVAVSRAKDQLWVVHSLDSANDLKSGDIRKKLIEYSLNPNSILTNNAKTEKESESPFEEAVAKALFARGYKLVQQWKVGSYRLDMVVVFGKKKIAIECDGERWHSGDNKIREDMERQTILERLGWQFIRIRGSEYYSNPENTMQRVVEELNNYGIEPNNGTAVCDCPNNSTDLLERIKLRAHNILNKDKIKDCHGFNINESAADAKNNRNNNVIKSNSFRNSEESVQEKEINVSNKSTIQNKEDLNKKLSQLKVSVEIKEKMPVKDDFEKFRLLKKAASDGNKEAEKKVAYMYYNGIGTEKNLKEAFFWFKKAAKKDEPEAQFYLAYMYETGEGTVQDYSEAFKWYHRSAKNNYVKSQNYVGSMYQKGNGVEKNLIKAKEWYEKAAEQNYSYAQFNLGNLYFSGCGVEKDYAKAKEWFEKAASQGYKEAKEKLKKLKI